jgi:dihydroorotate dehydrogenase electron transfer subunit
MLRIDNGFFPLLPRPFSINRLMRSEEGIEGIEILYKKVGKGTQKMSLLRKEDSIRVLGPLGKGFQIPEGPRRVFVVAGGVGVAPLLFLVERILAGGVNPKACFVFLGGRTCEDILCHEEFLQMGVQVMVTTDDGSAGNQCLVTLPVEVAAEQNPPDIIFACGPKGMLDCVVRLSERLKISCQVSIESHMACGIGACRGCAVAGSGKDRYLHVCTDGPVFDSTKLHLESISCSTY